MIEVALPLDDTAEEEPYDHHRSPWSGLRVGDRARNWPINSGSDRTLGSAGRRPLMSASRICLWRRSCTRGLEQPHSGHFDYTILKHPTGVGSFSRTFQRMDPPQAKLNLSYLASQRTPRL